MGVAKKGCGYGLKNWSTGSKCLFRSQLMISGEKSFLTRKSTKNYFNSHTNPSSLVGRKRSRAPPLCQNSTGCPMSLDMSSNRFELLPKDYPVISWPNRRIFDVKCAIFWKYQKTQLSWAVGRCAENLYNFFDFCVIWGLYDNIQTQK